MRKHRRHAVQSILIFDRELLSACPFSSLSKMVYQDQGRNHRKSHIVSHVVDVENACDVIVISLAKYHLKVEEKLVADAESVLADVTGEAIKVIRVLTSPHHHFQR